LIEENNKNQITKTVKGRIGDIAMTVTDIERMMSPFASGILPQSRAIRFIRD